MGKTCDAIEERHPVLLALTMLSHALAFVGCSLGVALSFYLGGVRAIESWTISFVLVQAFLLRTFSARMSRRMIQNMVRGTIVLLCFSMALLAGRLADCACIGRCCGKIGEAAAITVFFSLVFLCLGLFLFCCHRQFRNWRVRVAGFALIFVWTCVTFYYAPSGNSANSGQTAFADRVLTVSSSAATTFITRRSNVEGASELWKVNRQWLQIAIALYVFSLMFSFFGRAAFNGLRVRFTLDRHKNVFWGLSDRELLLARSIVGSDVWAQIQVNLPVEKSYDSSAKARLTDLADELDGFWSFVDFTRPRRNCHSGRNHFFLSDDGNLNLTLANHVVQAVIDDEGACLEKTLYVRAGDIDHEEIFASWAKKAYERTGHLVRPVIIREPEMIARKFVEQFPPIDSPSMRDCVDVKRATVRSPDCRTLLLGFDHTGRALLNACLCQSRFVGADGKSTVAFPITVVDMKQARWDRYCLQSPEIVARLKDFALDFKCLQVGMPEFEAWIRVAHASYDRVVFCLQGDGVNIREALRLRDILLELGDRDKELIVRVSNPSVSLFVKMSHESVLPLRYFGNLKDVYSVGFINGDPVDRIARILNWQWNVNLDLDHDGRAAKLIHERDRDLIKEQHDDVERFWAAASYYERLSSRASAMAGLSFIRLFGLTWKPLGEIDEGCRVVPAHDADKLISACAGVMARTEHLRWCAYLWSQGYRTWDLQTPYTVAEVVSRKKSSRSGAPNKIANQTGDFRAHAALVDFDALPGIDLKLARAVDGEFYKAYDESAFEGRTRPRIANGSFAASLQCKDYDCWTVFPEAIELAGFRLVRNDVKDDETEAGPRNPDDSGGAFRRIGNGLLRFVKWSSRKDSVRAGNFAELEETRKNEILRMAEWAEDVYHASASMDAELSLEGCDGFLRASMVHCAEGEENSLAAKGLRVFWFDDSISPHFTLHEKKRVKTRFPLTFDCRTGMIRPLWRSVRSRKARRRMAKAIFGISGRRVDFEWQPDFVARVFRWRRGEKSKLVVVFRGTSSWSDCVEDVLQCFGRIPRQFRLSADLVRAVCESTEEDIVLVGHSKGGGQVQYALMRNGVQRWTRQRRIDGVTFNSQRLAPRTLEILRKLVEGPEALEKSQCAYANSHIENFRTRRDAVSGWLALGVNLLGRVFVVGRPGRLGVREHGILDVIASLKRELEKGASKA